MTISAVMIWIFHMDSDYIGLFEDYHFCNFKAGGWCSQYLLFPRKLFFRKNAYHLRSTC